MTTLTVLMPKLVVDGADRAIEFYGDALGAELEARYAGPDGSVVNAQLRIGDARFQLKDADHVDRSAKSIGGSAIVLTVELDDAYAAAERMKSAGATSLIPVADMPYGYRQGRLEDPFGYQWIVSQQTEDLSNAEVQERLDSWSA